MTLSPNCLRLIVIVANYNPRLAIVGMVDTLNEQDFHLLNTIPLAGRTFIAYSTGKGGELSYKVKKLVLGKK